MKLILVLLVVLASCKKTEDKPAAPSPAPTETKPEAKPETPPPATKCDAKLVIMADTMKWDLDGATGSTAYKRGTPTDLSFIKDPACSVNIIGSDSVTHQDLVHAMDQLLKAGYTDLSVGGDYPGPARKPPAPPSPVKLGDGLEGEKREWLKDAAVIVLSKTEAMVSGKAIGKPTDADLATKITAAIGEPKYNVAILQADESTPYPIVERAIEGAKRAGCDDVLIAVKNL